MSSIIDFALSDFHISYDEYIEMCDADLRHKTDCTIKVNSLCKSVLIISQAILLKNKPKRKVRFTDVNILIASEEENK